MRHPYFPAKAQEKNLYLQTHTVRGLNTSGACNLQLYRWLPSGFFAEMSFHCPPMVLLSAKIPQICTTSCQRLTAGVIALLSDKHRRQATPGINIPPGLSPS